MLEQAVLVRAGEKGGKVIKHYWTEEEREIVRRDYAGNNRSAVHIALRLGVTLCAVKGQVQRLGIARNIHNRWTKAEVEKLRELITQYAPITVAKRLHRSVNSVVVKSKRLGLHRRFRDGWYIKKEVCELLGVDHHKAQQWIDSKKLVAEWHTESQPQKNGGAVWHIKESNLKRFICRYSSELQGRNVDIYQVVNLLTGPTACAP